ncbi:unnamed protein product, partial [Polarella glacialis]
ESSESMPAMLGGAIPDIFRFAQPGSVLVFLDATHRLWPNLAVTAAAAGGFEMISPQGLNAHVHALAFLRSGPSASQGSCCGQGFASPKHFDTFAEHQRANEARF